MDSEKERLQGALTATRLVLVKPVDLDLMIENPIEYDYKTQQKALAGVANSILTKIYPGWVEAKNGLENYCMSMQYVLSEKTLQERFAAGDKEKIEAVVHKALDWSKNRIAAKEEFEAKQKWVEGVVNPIMTRVYQ